MAALLYILTDRTWSPTGCDLTESLVRQDAQKKKVGLSPSLFQRVIISLIHFWVFVFVHIFLSYKFSESSKIFYQHIHPLQTSKPPRDILGVAFPGFCCLF